MKHDTVLRRHFTPFRWTTVLLATFMAACAATGPALHDTARPGEFPSIGSAQWKEGSAPSIEALRQMRTGIDKDRVRSLLSWPHFREGIVGVREWNYIFHLRVAGRQSPLACQYMVRFSEQMLTTGLYWKDAECAALAASSPIKIVVKPVPFTPSAAWSTETLTLSADSVFRTDGAGPADIRPEGSRLLDLLAGEIRRHFGPIESITVTAHTDRMGVPALSDALSLARANTVREVLAGQGIDVQAIHARGRGQRQPLVDCPGAGSPAVLACLRSNRRIDIEIKGAQ